MKRIIGGILGVLFFFVVIPLIKSMVTAIKMKKLQRYASIKPSLFIRFLDTTQPFWDGSFTPRTGALIKMVLDNRPFWLVYSGPRNIHGSVSALLEDYRGFLKVNK